MSKTDKTTLPPRPKDGSRKAKVFDVYFADGLGAANELAKTLDIKPGTVRSWAGVWERSRGGSLPKAPKTEKPARERLTKERPAPKSTDVTKADERAPYDPEQEYSSHLSETRAQNWIIRRAEQNHMDPRSFHVIPYQDRYVVVPVDYKNSTPVPTFKKGDTVYDLTIKDSQAEVIEAGPEQSVIRYNKATKYRTGEHAVNNRYLFRLETPTIPAKGSKRERLEDKTPKKKGKTK